MTIELKIAMEQGFFVTDLDQIETKMQITNASV